MRDPDLHDAIDALREGVDDARDEAGASATRDRVLDSLERRGARRRTQASVLIVLAISLVGSAAWGWVSGWLPAAVDELRGAAPARLEPAPVAPSAARTPGVQRDAEPGERPEVAEATDPPEPPVPPAVVTPSVLPPSRPVGRPAPSTRTPAVPEAPVATNEAPVPKPAPAAPPADPELHAFRDAYEADFHGHDAARALAAWDAYLATFPDGKLAPEARWNRAVLLVRLGRSPEARAALAPFASGAEQGYRQAEARTLLGRLSPP